MSEHVSSKEPLFALDKDILDFNVKCIKTGISAKSLSEKPSSRIAVKNISRFPIAVRIVTTKKELYLVNPSYSAINPNEAAEIKFTYLSKEFIEDSSSHKFKFQAVSILPEFHLLQPKQIFDMYTKSDVKGFKTDEKGLRVILRKIMLEPESDSNAIQSGVSNAEPVGVYQTFGNAGKYPSFAANNDNSLNTKFEVTNNSVLNNASINYDYSSSGQNDLLVASGRKDNASGAVYDQESIRAEIQRLSLQLKFLESENAELNKKIKVAADERSKTTVGGSSETSSLLRNRKSNNTNLHPPAEKVLPARVVAIAGVVMFILGFILTK